MKTTKKKVKTIKTNTAIPLKPEDIVEGARIVEIEHPEWGVWILTTPTAKAVGF